MVTFTVICPVSATALPLIVADAAFAVDQVTTAVVADCIVAVIWAIIAAILGVVGKKALDQVRGVPQTTDSLGKIPNALKGQEEKNL